MYNLDQIQTHLEQAGLLIPDGLVTSGDHIPVTTTKGDMTWYVIYPDDGIYEYSDSNDKVIRTEIPKSTEWAEPESLGESVESQPYPMESLPPLMRNAVEEVLSFSQAPVALAVASAMSILSLAVQGHARVQRDRTLTSPVGLYQLIFAPSGERKTSTDSHFIKTVSEWQSEQHELAQPELTRYRADLEIWESVKAGVKNKIKAETQKSKDISLQVERLRQHESRKPIHPRVPKMLIEDATIESVKYQLATQYPAIGLVSNEGGVVFGSHSMSGDALMRAVTTWNSLWDGVLPPSDRRTTNSTPRLDVAATVSVMIQTGTFTAFIDKAGPLPNDSGFLARFLTYSPTSKIGYRPYKNPPEGLNKLRAFTQVITRLLNKDISISDTGNLEPSILTMDAEAKQAWIEFYNEVELSQRPDGELYRVQEVASKSADNLARMAALFHVLENGLNDPVIKVASVISAIPILAWHLLEAKKFYSESLLSREESNARKLDQWLISYCIKNKVPSIDRSSVQQIGPNATRKREEFTESIQILVTAERIHYIKEGKKNVIYINPSLLESIK